MSDLAAFRFGPFVLEPDERRLLRDGAPVDLTPKALDVLTVLVEQHGHLVTKDDLLETVWPDVVVDDNTLSVNVSRLRSALGEAAGEGRYIETVPRSGYRFVAAVVPERPVEEETVVMRRTRSHVRVEEREGTRWAPVLFALVGVAALGVALAAGARRPAPDPPPAVGPVPMATPTGSAVAGLPDPSRRALARAAHARGRALWWSRRPPPPGVISDAEEFRLALQHDPSFAPAYVGLAATHAFAYATAREVYPLLEQALALDPELSSAYAVLGFTRMMHNWDWAGGEADLRRALALDPADVSALQWLATLRMIQRRPDAADALLRRAVAVAPPAARASLLADRTQALYYAGAYEEAVGTFHRARTYDAQIGMGMAYAAMSLLYLDRPGDALAFVHALAPVTPAMRDRLAAAAGEGTTALVRELVSVPDPTENLHTSLTLAHLHAFLGDADAALDHLERSLAVRDFMLPFVHADPAYDALRDEPRFEAVMAALGLEPSDRGVAPTRP